MDNEKYDNERFMCPLGRFFQDIERAVGGKSEFCKHMTQSRLEFLRAMKSLVDAKIEDIEKKTASKGPQKATKIEVE